MEEEIQEIAIHVKKDFSPGKWMWYEPTTYGTLTLRSYGFDTPEHAFDDGVRDVSNHYSRPELLSFKMVQH